MDYGSLRWKVRVMCVHVCVWVLCVYMCVHVCVWVLCVYMCVCVGVMCVHVCTYMCVCLCDYMYTLYYVMQ